MYKKAAIALIAFFSTVSYADVQLLVDPHIKVTAINGEAITQSPFRPLQTQFTLGAGVSVITAKYERLYDLSRDDHDIVRSKDITVSADLTDNQSYRLTLLKVPERYDEAKQYAKSPTLAITQNGQTIASQNTTQSSSGLLDNIGALFGYQKSSTANNQKAIQAIQNPAPTAPVTAARNNTLDQFMQLWLQASEEEREKIRQWIAK